MSDRKKVIKSLFLILSFLTIGIFIHVAIISVVTFFHLQLGHRFVDIQDWIYANGWFLHIVKSICSFYVIEKILSIVNYENNGFSSVIQNFKLDVDYKMPTVVILIMIVSCFLSLSPEANILHHIEIGSLLLSYLGHFTFFVTHTLFLMLLFNKINMEKVSKTLVTLLYVGLVYGTEQVFFKFQENHERSAIAFLLILIYISTISERKYLKLSLGFILFFLCPFLTLFGLDLVWGSHYSPYVLGHTFTLFDAAYLSATVAFFLYLHKRAKVL